MAEFRNIHTRIWTDAWFCELGAEEKLIFIYLFSNPNASVCGMYELPKRNISMDTGVSIDRVNIILDGFSTAGKVFYEDGIVWVVNLKKYNDSGDSIKIKTRILKDLEAIGDCPIKRKYINTLSEKPDTLSGKKERDGDGNETDTETETETETSADPFSIVQHSLEKITGIPATQSSMDAIKEIVAMKATVEDIQAGYAWYQNQRKPLKYHGSLVGPTRTAMARRLADESKWTEPPPKKKLTMEEVVAGEARALARSANV